MAEMKDIVKLAVDSYKGRVEKYTVGQSQEALRQALIEANGGSTKLNYKAIRDGKCNGLFTLIEEILSRTVIEGVQSDDFFNAFVDYRNVAEGDKNLFIVEDSTLFVVDDVADGNQGIRRQRLGGSTETSIPTSMKMVRIYEELNRVLSGRVDFNTFIASLNAGSPLFKATFTFFLYINLTIAGSFLSSSSNIFLIEFSTTSA